MNNNFNKKILLTGHRGYVGVILTKLLLDKGYDVVGLDTNYYEGCQFVDFIRPKEEIKKDIRDITVDDLAGIGSVIHLAGLSNDPLGALNPKLTDDINFKATVKLATLAKNLGIRRFIYASSCSVYGVAGEDMVDEKSSLNPQTEYAVSKLKSEVALRELTDGDFLPTILRPGTAYGFSPVLRGDLVVNNLVGWGFLTKKIKITSNGTPWRPLIHVKDFSSGFLACLEAPLELVGGQTFNLGRTEENFKVSEIAEIIKNNIPSCEIEYTNRDNNDNRSFRVNFDKISSILSDYFRPVWSLPIGAKEVYDSYEKYNLIEEDFFGNKYMHIKQIEVLIKNKVLSEDLFWINEPKKH